MPMPEDIKHKVYVHWAQLRDVYFSHLTNLTWATPKRARFGVPKREGSRRRNMLRSCTTHFLKTLASSLALAQCVWAPGIVSFFDVWARGRKTMQRCCHMFSYVPGVFTTLHYAIRTSVLIMVWLVRGPQYTWAQKTQLVEAFFTWYTLSLFWKLRWAVWTPDLFNPQCLSPNQISLQI